MKPGGFHNLPLAAIVAFTVVLGACTDQDPGSLTGPQNTIVHANRGLPHDLEVYSQNLYLGGDTGPLFSIDFSNPVAIVEATQTFWASVQASDIPSRAIEIVDEIEARMPHVVALQEAFQFTEIAFTPAPQPVAHFDLLAAIQAEIVARDLPYGRSEVIMTTDGALPLGIDFSTFDFTGVLQFADRNAVLVRDDLENVDFASKIYDAFIPIPQPTPLLLVERAWILASFDFDGTRHNVVATHLETQGAQPIHNWQADELIATLNTLEGPTIVMGDLNSDAAGQPGDPSWTPTYGRLTGAEGGFTDAWDVAAHSRNDPGFTCCTAKDLMGPANLDERIDFVLYRDVESLEGEGQHRGFINMDIIGMRRLDQTAGGLWPSDHAGLTATLRMPLGMR